MCSCSEMCPNKSSIKYIKENQPTGGFRPKFRKAVIISLVGYLIFMVWFALKLSNTHGYSVAYQHLSDNKHKNETIKYILLYNKFWENELWDLETSQIDSAYFARNHCPVTACIVTHDKKLLSSIEEYDALVVHMIEPYGYQVQLPLTKSPSQIYVAASLESPLTYPGIVDMDRSSNNLFNWLFTYETYAEVPWLITLIKDAVTNEIVAPAENPIWRKVDVNYTNDTDLLLAKSKTKLAACLVSNCVSHSFRLSLLKDLGKYMEVDVIGKCANSFKFKMLCPKKGSDFSRCNDKLMKEYKFYFAFENSLCEDYVTEKFFNNMKLPIIPVVYGGANYSRFAPPHSYIDVNDFDTTKELADYLKFLAEHPEEYIKYFWWKKHYTVMEQTLFNGFCELCKKLHDPEALAKPHIYSDLQKWWTRDNVCHSNPRIQFPHIPDDQM